MPAKEPQNFQLFGWLLVGLASLLGGLARFSSDWQEGKVVFRVANVLAQLVVSIFAGLLGGLVCNYSGLDLLGALIGASVSSFLGRSAIDRIGKIIERKVGVSNE